MPLKIRQCETAKCPPNKPMVVLFDGDGLSLRITQTQKKSWIYQYTHNKKRNNITLGSYTDLGLAQAREARDKFKRIVASGKDPKIVKNMQIEDTQQAYINTIGYLYVKAKDELIKAKKWSDSHTRRNKFTWKHLSHLENVPITELSKRRLRETLVRIRENIGASTAEKCKALMSSIYTYAMLNDIVDANLITSFAKDPILKKRRPDEVEKQPPIPSDRFGETWDLILNSKMHMPTKYALLCLQITAMRVSSLLKRKWADYDETRRVLKTPLQDVKNRKAINCPVSNKMTDLLKALKQAQKNVNPKWSDQGYIFSPDGVLPISKESPNNALKKLLLKNDLGFRANPHGFRTSCEVEWQKQQFIDSAINVQQDHSSTTGNMVRDRYISNDEDFFDERMKMVEFMSKFIDDQIDSHKKLQNAIARAKDGTVSTTN